jgi:TonB family protein
MDSVLICGLNIKVQKQKVIAGKVEKEIDYRIKLIQDFYSNGRIKSENFWLQETTPIWIQRFYNKKGEIIKTKEVNNDNYGICFALQQGKKHDLLKKDSYLDYFSENHWEYPNHWFVGYDYNVSNTGHETKGIVIDKKTGEIKNYYTMLTLYPDNEDEVEEVGIFIVEHAPEFPGGIDSLRNFLQSSISIPNDSIINGRVFIQFWIDTTGRPIDSRVVRGINPHQDNEALRIVNSMPNWKPGEQRGKKIQVPFTVPIIFRKIDE